MIPKQKILIVDDSPENVRMLNEAVREECETYFALSGEEALQQARDRKPDLILLDVMMPGMDGYEVCRLMKAEAALQDIPIIFITSLGQAEMETRGLELGAVDYISKPFNPASVRLRVRNQLTLKMQRDLLEERRAELEAALAKVKTLSGLLPICCSCKKIRDDQGYWNQVESYIRDHSTATFTHGFCPECAAKWLEDARRLNR